MLALYIKFLVLSTFRALILYYLHSKLFFCQNVVNISFPPEKNLCLPS